MPDSIRTSVLRLLDTAQAGTLPPIVQAGHPALRTVAEPWSGQLDAAELTALIEVMRHSMHAAPGVGLAAPQLGIPLQLAVLEDSFAVSEEVQQVREREPLPFFAILNPRYQPLGTEQAVFYEGCLSVSGWQAVVSRHRSVTLTFTDADGVAQSRQFTGWQARIVQHETDHLSGTLYLDRAELRSLSDNAEYAARWAQPGIELAQHGLGF